MSDADATDPIAGDVLAALATPELYPHRPARVEHLQTHISHVFLAGDEVYKLKKAVRFPFLDFRTRAQRRHFCLEELRLNRRLAAPIYLDVVALVRRDDGTVALGPSLADGGDRPFVEPVLRMRRLPADRMLPALLAADAVEPGMMEGLARRIAAFHRAAPTGPAIAAEAAPDALRRRFADILATLAPFVGDVLHADEHATLVEFGERFVRSHADLLRTRQREGRIREGHGDLHAEHVCFAEEVYVFDCIEFSVPFRCNDVASEVAFLTMDLEFRARRDLADAFAAAYASAAGDATLPRLLPYYAAFRACVRATVAALTSAESEVDAAERAAAHARARTYVELALRSAWRAGDPVVVVCCGLSGTGKSTLAAALAPVLDADVLRSDVIRKRGDPAGGPLVAAAERYRPAARAAVYATLVAEVEARLATGRSVVADATFLRRADRAAVAAAAARHGRPVVFVETVASPETVQARLAARRPDDVSDARVETYVAQQAGAEAWTSAEPRLAVATDAAVADVRARAMRALFTWRGP